MIPRYDKGRGRDGGFTLVEVMLAMLILGIVTATVYGAWTGTLRVAREGDHVDQVYAMGRKAMMHLAEDLESMAPWGGTFVLEGGKQDRYGEPFTNLRFVTSRRLGLSSTGGGLPEVSWFGIEEDEGWVLMRGERIYQENGIGGYSMAFEKEGAFVVAEGLESLRCLFVDPAGEVHERWDSLSDFGDQKNRLPRQIEIRMEFVNPDNPDRPWLFMTRVVIPRAEGGAR